MLIAETSRLYVADDEIYVFQNGGTLIHWWCLLHSTREMKNRFWRVHQKIWLNTLTRETCNLLHTITVDFPMLYVREWGRFFFKIWVTYLKSMHVGNIVPARTCFCIGYITRIVDIGKLTYLRPQYVRKTLTPSKYFDDVHENCIKSATVLLLRIYDSLTETANDIDIYHALLRWKWVFTH